MKAVLLLAALPLFAGAASGSSVSAKIQVPGTPCGVAGATGAVWVTDPQASRLLRIDPATNAVTKQVRTDTTPCELKYAVGSLWVVTQSGKVDRFDPATSKRLASIAVGITTYDLTYALRSIWVTNRNGGTVQRISPATNRVVRTVTFPLGAAPAGIGYAAGALWVGDDHGRAVFRLDPRTYRLTRVASGGDAASWIAVNGNDVWVSNTKSGSVTRIDGLHRKATATRQGRRQPGEPGRDRRRRLGPRRPRERGCPDRRRDRQGGRDDPDRPQPGRRRRRGGDVWVSMFDEAQVWRIHPE